MALRMRGDGVPDAAIDKYMKREAQMSLEDVMSPKTRDYLRAAGMGASFGFADELAGAGAAIMPGGKGYTEARDEVRQNYDAAKGVAPGRMMAAELGGGLASSLVGGGLVGAGAKGAGLGARAVMGALSGGAAGGTAGVGYSKDHAVRAGLTGAAAGAALGGAIPLAGATIAAPFKYLAKRLNPTGAVANATGHLLPEGAEAAMARQEALAPGTAVPAALSPDLPASLRVIGASPKVAREAQAASELRASKIHDAMREVGDQYESLLGGHRANLSGAGAPDIRKLAVVENGMLPDVMSDGTETLQLRAVQALREKLRVKMEGAKGTPKHELGVRVKQLSKWLSFHKPEIGQLDADYHVLASAKRAEAGILKNIRQSRKSYSSNRSAGIEPGSPGASLPSAGSLMHDLLKADKKGNAEAVNRLLLQPGQIPPQLLKAQARSAKRSFPYGLLGSVSGGDVLGQMSGSLLGQ